MNRIAVGTLGLAIVVLAGLNIYQQRTIEDLRAQLTISRDKQTSEMHDTLNALQLVQKYQTYLKEKGIPLP